MLSGEIVHKNNHYHYFFLAVIAASHPPPVLTLSPRYVNSLTVSTSPHNYSPCSTAYPIFPSHRWHAKYIQNVESPVTSFTPAYLPRIHLLHCTRNTEIAFTLKLQTLHGSTLLLDKPSCVMLPLIITLVLPKDNLQTLTFKSLLPFK